MLSAFVASHAQFKGVPFDEAISVEEAEDLTVEELYNVLVKMDADSVTGYTYFYEVKSKGYYDALKQLSWILEANGISRSADIEDSYFPSYIDEKDYNQVVFQLSMESGWIERSWYVYDDNWKIMMIGNDEVIMVVVGHDKTGKGLGNEGIAKNAFSSGRNASSNQSTSEGVSSRTGRGLGNEGISYNLSGRTPQSLPKPSHKYQVEGKVVVEVTVDRNGKVTQATPGVKGSTTLDENLLSAARKAAMAAQFDKNPDTPAFQKGTITYFFTLQ